MKDPEGSGPHMSALRDVRKISAASSASGSVRRSCPLAHDRSVCGYLLIKRTGVPNYSSKNSFLEICAQKTAAGS